MARGFILLTTMVTALFDSSLASDDIPGVILTGDSGIPRFAHDLLARDTFLPRLEPRQYCYADQGLGTCPGGHCCYLTDYCTTTGCCPRDTGTTCGHGRGCWAKDVVCCGYNACNPGDKCNSGVGCCKPEWTMCDRYCCEAGYRCSSSWGYCTKLGGSGGGGGGGGIPPGDETNPNPDKPDPPPPPPADDDPPPTDENPNEPTQSPQPDPEPTDPPPPPPPPPADETTSTTAVVTSRPPPPPEEPEPEPEPEVEDETTEISTTTSSTTTSDDPLPTFPSLTLPDIPDFPQITDGGGGFGTDDLTGAGSALIPNVEKTIMTMLGVWVMWMFL